LINLRGLILMVFEFVYRSNSRGVAFEPQFEALVEAQLRQQIQVVLRKGLEPAAHPSDAQTTTTAASWSIYGLAHPWYHDKKRLAMEKQVDRVLPLIAAILALTSPAM
jgi:ribulose bisphosphate carboxylase small subunit